MSEQRRQTSRSAFALRGGRRFLPLVALLLGRRSQRICFLVDALPKPKIDSHAAPPIYEMASRTIPLRSPFAAGHGRASHPLCLSRSLHSLYIEGRRASRRTNNAQTFGSFPNDSEPRRQWNPFQMSGAPRRTKVQYAAAVRLAIIRQLNSNYYETKNVDHACVQLCSRQLAPGRTARLQAGGPGPAAM